MTNELAKLSLQVGRPGRVGGATAAAAGADRREDILRTVRSVTGQGQARSGYGG